MSIIGLKYVVYRDPNVEMTKGKNISMHKTIYNLLFSQILYSSQNQAYQIVGSLAVFVQRPKRKNDG